VATYAAAQQLRSFVTHLSAALFGSALPTLLYGDEQPVWSVSSTRSVWGRPGAACQQSRRCITRCCSSAAVELHMRRLCCRPRDGVSRTFPLGPRVQNAAPLISIPQGSHATPAAPESSPSPASVCNPPWWWKAPADVAVNCLPLALWTAQATTIMTPALRTGCVRYPLLCCSLFQQKPF